jgi:hypothetical protein
MKHNLRVQQSIMGSTDKDLKKMAIDIVQIRIRADLVEQVSKENEILKVHNLTLQNSIKELSSTNQQVEENVSGLRECNALAKKQSEEMKRQLSKAKQG